MSDSVKPLFAADLAARFGKSNRWAAKLLRRMRHVPGREPFTTEEWLAEWLAAKSIPQQTWIERSVTIDPLDAFVMRKCVELVGNLARAGKIEVKAL